MSGTTTLTLYAHPFSSYCQKVLIALYENATPFALRMMGTPEVNADLAALWPMKKMPLLVDGERTVKESSVIIEYLGLHHPGPVRLIPADAAAALEVRCMDRCFDNYVMAPLQQIVNDALRPEEHRNPQDRVNARAQLDTAYRWLDGYMAGRTWAVGSDFSLADCAAAPALCYADWGHPIPEAFAHLRSYRRRLLARPSYARAVDEARPFRPYFPLGAPDRD